MRQCRASFRGETQSGLGRLKIHAIISPKPTISLRRIQHPNQTHAIDAHSRKGAACQLLVPGTTKSLRSNDLRQRATTVDHREPDEAAEQPGRWPQPSRSPLGVLQNGYRSRARTHFTRAPWKRQAKRASALSVLTARVA